MREFFISFRKMVQSPEVGLSYLFSAVLSRGVALPHLPVLSILHIIISHSDKQSVCFLCRCDITWSLPAVPFLANPVPPLSSSYTDVLEWPQLFGFPFLGVPCGLFQCLTSSFRFHFLKWASEDLFLQRQNPVAWGSGVCVKLTREVVHHSPGSGMLLLSSPPSSLHLLLVSTRLLRVLAEQNPWVWAWVVGVTSSTKS